MNKWTET